MTKKDYVVVAEAIKQTNSYMHGLEKDQATGAQMYADQLINQLGIAFQRDNMNFSQQRFEDFINKVF